MKIVKSMITTKEQQRWKHFQIVLFLFELKNNKNKKKQAIRIN